MTCRIKTTGVFPLSSAPASARRVQVRCSQISNSAARDYSSLDKYELKKELRTRGLSISGGREQLIHRLHLSDAPPTLPDVEEATQDALPPTVVAAEIEIKEEEQAAAPVKKTRAARKKKTTTDSVPSPPAIVADHADQPLNEVALLKLGKGELQCMAAARGVSKSGTKAQLVVRIMEVIQLGDGVAAAEAPAAVAPKKKRVVKKKKITISKQTGTQNDTDKQSLENSTKTTHLPTTTTITPAYQPPPLRLNETAALKRDEALSAAVTVVTALNSKRRVLAMMEEVISVAVTTAAAQNVKWAQQQDQAQKEQGAEKNIVVEDEAKVVSKRRVLSPDEAAKVLKEVVRRKGTGGVGLGTGDKKNIDSCNSGGSGGAAAADLVVALSGSIKQTEVASEVDSMKTVMAGLKKRLNTQEENTEQLRVAIQSIPSSKTTATAAAVAPVQVEQQEQGTIDEEKIVVSTVNNQDETPVTAPDMSDNVQATIDFALTLGKAISVVGRELFNSFMKKNR